MPPKKPKRKKSDKPAISKESLQVAAPVIAPPVKKANPLAELVVAWRENPLAFVRDVLGVNDIDPWQLQVLDWLKDGEKRISVRSGHGVGKTALEAWLILWFGTTREDVKIGVTAPAAPQIDVALWPELRKWHAAMRDGNKVARWFSTQIAITEGFVKWANGNFAAARTARPDQPEALQGLHASNVLILADEASGIEDKIWEANIGALSTEGAIQALFSNPTRNSGYFYDTQTNTKLADVWKRIRVSSADVPRARGHVDDVIARYGLESNQYRVRVLGEFPLAEDDAVIPLHLLEAAIDRRGKTDRVRGVAPVWGVDVAWMGSDRSALAKRCANELLEPVKWWTGNDPLQTALRVYNEWMDTNAEDRPASICVDTIGMGAGTYAKLRELGLPARPVNVGEAASTEDRYSKLRDELWFKGREWLADLTAIMPDDAQLVGELASVHYSMLPSGKIKVESKDEMRKRGQRSPDLADAFLLTFAGGDHKRAWREPNRAYQSSSGSRGQTYYTQRTWMSG